MAVPGVAGPSCSSFGKPNAPDGRTLHEGGRALHGYDLPGMPRVAYSVRAMFPDRSLVREYIRWLAHGHVQEVLRAGASEAAIIEHAEPVDPPCVESRYIFADRPGLDAYLQHHAPALRAQGLELFPPSKGVRFERSIGEIIETFSA